VDSSSCPCQNCANLRKRITLLPGWGKWSAMQDWYDAPRFRGHVREPDVEDLRYIARDMELTQVRILGRNWAGRGSPRRLIRMITPFVDSMLRLRSSLCSDLYLIGNNRGLSLSVCAPINSPHRKQDALSGHIQPGAAYSEQRDVWN
jgi:hypothetical protein